MTDTEREMLEAAANAAGLSYKDDMWLSAPHVQRPDGLWEPWNPLADDGDALRLAADLRLKIIPGKYKGDGCTVESQRDGIAGCTAFRDDPSAQMRDAIVFVAANIGRAQR